MIAIDRREGSAHLIELLPPGVATVTTLPFGDACWYGFGPGGKTVKVGVECKRVTDLLACMRDHRFVGQQLPGMAQVFDYLYLLIEGATRPHPANGNLQQWAQYRPDDPNAGRWVDVRFGGGAAPAITYAAWAHHLETLRRKTPLRLVHTTSPHHTARELLGLYQWWATSGGWDTHQSHTGVHVPPDPHVMGLPQQVYRRTALKVAQQLPGVRDVLATRVADRFDTVAQMVGANVEDWAQVEGIGPVKAVGIVAALWGPGAADRAAQQQLQPTSTKTTPTPPNKKRKVNNV